MIRRELGVFHTSLRNDYHLVTQLFLLSNTGRYKTSSGKPEKTLSAAEKSTTVSHCEGITGNLISTCASSACL